ncbi:MAG TPA: substrate-binding domain-containing protein [Gemmataceae bacterium]|nr:substrate-binding domain-containing protein [Gemmataceae bacterium]
MKSLRVVGITAAALALGLLTGCQPESGKPKVGFVSNNPESFWTIAEAGANKAAAESNVDLIFQRPQQGDPAVQRETVDGVINQGAKAVAVSVIDPKNQKEYLDKIAGKVQLLTVDNDAPDTHRVCYIGTDNYEGGKAVGRLVKMALPKGGTIAIFVGDLAPLNAQQRCEGVLDELAGQKDVAMANGKFKKPDTGAVYGKDVKYTLHDIYLDQPEGAQKAKTNARAAVSDLKDKDGVCMIGLWAYNPPAILSAVNDYVKDGKIKKGQIKIVGFDENAETLQGIIDDDILGTVVQNPYEFGFQSVSLMAQLVKGDKSKVPPDGVIPIEFRIITKDGGQDFLETVHGQKKSIPVKEFRDQLNTLLGKK